METSVIRYNLRERGRRYRGSERNFDIPTIVNAINSPECQERVKNRDMLGYYGHWPRIKFGMLPQEGSMALGRPAIVEPALVTVYLKASPDGTIEHKAEFLGTDSGQVAAKLYASRTGGFSSAIDCDIPCFFGLDYVLEPNYSTNRGYALDSVSGISLDAVDNEIQNEQLRGMKILLDSAMVERDMVNQTIERLSAENEYLLGKIAAAEMGKKSISLDSTQAHIMPLSVSMGREQQIKRDTDFFHSSPLPIVLDAVTKEAKDPQKDSFYDRCASKILR